MHILFLTVGRINSIEERGIYADLLRVLASQGHEVFIASPAERRYHQPTRLTEKDNVHFLKIKTLNIQKTNVIEKGIGTLLLEYQFLGAIEKYWGNVKFDLVLYSTPPITFNKVIEKIKKKHNAKSYLLLKDIFPQNAVDLGMFKKDSALYKLFRKKEKKLYSLSDKIGCMSPANRDYILRNNPEVNPAIVEVFPNSMIPLEFKPSSKENRDKILSSLNISPDKVISLYGGNLGKPQGIDFLIEVVKDNERRSNHHIIIVGDGTEYGKLAAWFEHNKPNNATLLSRLPKAEYDQLARCADIGLIFLDHRFTIPNYPSRLLAYIENAIPVMIASDPNTDIGRMAEEGGYGLWCESNSIEAFNDKLDTLIYDPSLRSEMGRSSRSYFENNLDVRNHVQKILQTID